MKKKDIIQLVKETVKENTFYGNREQPSTLGSTTAVVPTDEYPFSRRPKRTATGMMEKSTSNKLKDQPFPVVGEDLNEEGESWGLDIRRLADSFTFEELEQLYNDNKISKEDLNGAKSYLQAWIDQHPTYLPQRDLTSPKRQKIRDKYLSENTAPKEMAGRIKSVFDKVNGAQHPVQTPEWHKNRFKNKYGISFPEDIKNINKDQALAMNKYSNDMKNNIKEDITDDISKAEDEAQAATQAKADAVQKVADARKKKADAEKSSLEEDSNSLLSEYIKERGDSNLMEHIDKYRKRAVLMEGAMKKFFEMFDMGKTDEEIIQDYAQRGTQVPEAFVSKARKQYEGLKKMKLELEMSEKEYKNSATQMVNNPNGQEEGMEMGMEEKQLATSLTNEVKTSKAINKI